MGWGRYLLLGDLGQQLDIQDQKQEIEDMRSRLLASRIAANGWSDAAQSLERENDELKLYLMAVVRLLKAKGVITQEELRSMVDTIDTEDGVKDGRVTRK